MVSKATCMEMGGLRPQNSRFTELSTNWYKISQKMFDFLRLLTKSSDSVNSWLVKILDGVNMRLHWSTKVRKRRLEGSTCPSRIQTLLCFIDVLKVWCSNACSKHALIATQIRVWFGTITFFFWGHIKTKVWPSLNPAFCIV